MLSSKFNDRFKSSPLYLAIHYSYKSAVFGSELHKHLHDLCTTFFCHIHLVICEKFVSQLMIHNAPINVMPHYPPPGQCWGIGGDLNLAKFKSTTHWARQSVKSQPSPHSIIEEKMGNLIVGAFNCSTCIW